MQRLHLKQNLETTVQTPRSGVSLLAQAQNEYEAGRFYLAEHLYGQVLALVPGDANAHFMRGLIAAAGRGGRELSESSGTAAGLS